VPLGDLFFSSRPVAQISLNYNDEAQAALAATLVVQALPVVEHSSAQSVAEPKRAEIPKKSSENPWRKFKFGKALYQHPSLPKS